MWLAGTRAWRKLGCLTYLSFFASFALVVFTRGLPALVASLAGAVDAGRSPRGPSGGDPRNEGIGGGGARRELPRASEMVVPP